MKVIKAARRKIRYKVGDNVIIWRINKVGEIIKISSVIENVNGKIYFDFLHEDAIPLYTVKVGENIYDNLRASNLWKNNEYNRKRWGR